MPDVSEHCEGASRVIQSRLAPAGGNCRETFIWSGLIARIDTLRLVLGRLHEYVRLTALAARVRRQERQLTPPWPPCATSTGFTDSPTYF